MFLSAELSLQPQRIFFLVWNPVVTTEEETNPDVSSCVVCTNMFLSVYFHCLMISSKCSQNRGALLCKIGGYSLRHGLNLHQPYLETQKNLPLATCFSQYHAGSGWHQPLLFHLDS